MSSFAVDAVDQQSRLAKIRVGSPAPAMGPGTLDTGDKDHAAV
jgi:hypothetical protein